MTGVETTFALQGYLNLPGLTGLLAKGFLICLLGLFILRDFALSAAAVKHRIALGTLHGLALLPVIAWLAPHWHLPLLPKSNSLAPQGDSLWITGLLWCYVVVTVLLGSRLVLHIARIGRISMRAGRTPDERFSRIADGIVPGHVTLKFSDEVQGPLTWGALKPTIILPMSHQHWTANERAMVLRHEMAHIARGDWLAILLARWASVLYWPVPGVRRLLRELSLSAEQACDDRVLAEGSDAADYADLLLKQARREQVPATLALAQPADIAVRIRYLVREIVDRSTLDPSRRWVYPACALLMLPLSTVSMVEKSVTDHAARFHWAQPWEAPARTADKARPLVPIMRPAPPRKVLSPPPALAEPEFAQPTGEPR